METNGDGGAEWAGLAARVGELEREVAELRAEKEARVAGSLAGAAGFVIGPRRDVGGAAPPPMPSAGVRAGAREISQAGPRTMDEVLRGMAHGGAAAAAMPGAGPVGAGPVEFGPVKAGPVVARKSFEERLGSQIFPLVAGAALLVGMAYFLKLAIEYGWIGPVARVVIGLVAGAGVVVGSEWLRRRGFAAFSYVLKAVGAGVLYLTLWAAFHLYGLMPATVALVAMIAVTGWNAWMAWRQDAELLAAYALVGGFATPLLLSTGGNHETFLFTYVGAMAAATVLLVRWKPWERLLVPVFLGTTAYFIGWYVRWFHQVAVSGVWDGESTETALFALVFCGIFAAVSLKGPGRRAEDYSLIEAVLLPLGNATFAGCALYSVVQDSGLHAWLPWVMVGLAGVFLGLMRLQRTRIAGAMHLAAAVVFLTVAIPLKASGHTLTTAWFVEGLVLYWAATKFEGSSREVLRWLSGAGYGLGLGSLLAHWFLFGVAGDRAGDFFNRHLGASLVGVGALGAGVWLTGKQAGGEDGGLRQERTMWALLLAIDLVGVLLGLRELGVSRYDTAAHAAFLNADFATALVGLAVLAGAGWVAYRARGKDDAGRGDGVAGVSMVLFNLLAILSVEREIGALWRRSDANLQRSLAISGFLMLYGAGLLAVGFWRRNAFVRWQALALLVFTICKVFLYDISGLSAGYRVVSFLALGAMLMVVSFAYQKDWLGLKGAGVAGPVEVGE